MSHDLCRKHYQYAWEHDLVESMSVREKVGNSLFELKRFWSRADCSGDCWIWTGDLHQKGYGRIYWRGKKSAAHKVAYELIFGPVPEGLELDHTCNVRECVNPWHLEAVTHQENIRRRDIRRALRLEAA